MSPQHKNIKVHWLQENLVVTNGPLANDPNIRNCLEIQQRLDRKGQEMSEKVLVTGRLIARQDRVRKKHRTGGHDDPDDGEMAADLGEAEARINELEEQTIPKLREQERAIRDELRNAMISLAADWKSM